MKKLLIYLLQLLQIRATIVDLRKSPNFLNYSSWSIILIKNSFNQVHKRDFISVSIK